MTTRKPRKALGKPEVRHSRAGFIVFEFLPQGITLLRNFTRSVASGSVPESWVLADLARRLQQILDGVPADKALGLQAGRGNKYTKAQQLRDQQIAAEVEYLYAQCGRGPRNSVLSKVAGRYHRSESQIKKIYLADQRKRRRIARTISKGTKK